jgi:hypothetical protein
MADNFTTLDAASATITGAADEIGGVKFPRIKLIVGADGTNDGDVCTANPMPVTGTVNATCSGTVAVTGMTTCNTGAVAGTVTANAGTNLNTSALALEAGGNLADIKTAVQVIDNCISGNEAQVDVVAALPAGTNNIGDVDILSFAGGKTILRAVISGATSGDNTIVAADATKKIKVLSLFLVAATAVTVRFESAAGGTALTGVMSIGATGGFVLPPPADPTNHWFETSANQLLNMELGGAVQVSGAITYYLEA